MTDILVAIDGSDANAHVLEAAIEQAELERGTLVAVHVIPRAEYLSRVRSVAGSRDLRRDGFTYTLSQARADAARVADRALRRAIGRRDVPYVAVGEVGEPTRALLATAADHDCGVLVLPAVESWWRRRLGLADRALTKQFDGAVVRVPRPTAPPLDPTQPSPAR